MITSVHQPHFLPWMGYLNKALRSDVFVWLHSVQYRKNYFQNRTRIKGVNDQPLWLTLPVHARLGMRIDEVTIAEPSWRKAISRTVEQYYQKAPYFAACWPPIAGALLEASDSLDDVNFRTFSALLSLLNAGTLRVLRAGELSADSADPTDRLVELCVATGAKRYIAGKGGHKYLRLEAFERAGIEIIWQAFEPSQVIYPQIGKSFVPGLSAIDCLFNVGPEQTRSLALAAWTP